MINTKDVIRMKIPYPTINSGLAYSSHMYVCMSADKTNYHFIKCQTLKPYMLTRQLFKHFVDELPDLNRNPFKRTTRIDCDKLFTTISVKYDDALKTTLRPDVCDDLYDNIGRELYADGYDTIPLDEDALKTLNNEISDA